MCHTQVNIPEPININVKDAVQVEICGNYKQEKEILNKFNWQFEVEPYNNKLVFAVVFENAMGTVQGSLVYGDRQACWPRMGCP